MRVVERCEVSLMGLLEVPGQLRGGACWLPGGTPGMLQAPFGTLWRSLDVLGVAL